MMRSPVKNRPYDSSNRERQARETRRRIVEAADVIWTLASERTYLALIRDRGWKADTYERWIAEQLEAALLAHQ